MASRRQASGRSDLGRPHGGGDLARAGFAALVVFGAAVLGSISEPATADEGLFERDRLTGGWGGVRKQLEDAGISFGLNDTAETLSNPTGGIRQLTIYQGLLDVSLNLDLEKLAKWPDATFYIDGYWISGRGLSRNAVGNLLAVSSIEALASTRLHDMWFQQEFLDHQISLRVGQIALDDEFYISQYSAGFVSSSFGCPDILSTDLPSGGPCYPFAVPGARLRVAPTSNLTLSAAVFNGNPAPRGPGDPQVRNSSGTNFLIGEGGFMPIAELAYSFDEQPISSTPLSDVKLGAWYHTGEFPDQRRDSSGLSLANPASNGIPAMHGSNFGAYLVVDNMCGAVPIRRPRVWPPSFASATPLPTAICSASRSTPASPSRASSRTASSTCWALAQSMGGLAIPAAWTGIRFSSPVSSVRYAITSACSKSPTKHELRHGGCCSRICNWSSTLAVIPRRPALRPGLAQSRMLWSSVFGPVSHSKSSDSELGDFGLSDGASSAAGA